MRSLRQGPRGIIRPPVIIHPTSCFSITDAETEEMDSSSPPPPPVDSLACVTHFFRAHEIQNSPSSTANRKDFFSDLIRSLLSVDVVQPGHILCTLTVNPTVANVYNTLHGGVVASVAEVVTLACAKTAAGDKELFLGEMTTSYLSAARIHDKVEVEASILRQGRRVIVISVDFRNKTTQKLLYTSRTTVYIMPLASL